MKSRIKNERGDMSFFSIFLILAINMLLSFVLLYASVQINCINIRNPLYQFDVTDNITDAYGNITVIGSHKKLGGISDNLKRRMLDNGVPAGKLKPFLPDAPCKEGGK